MICYDVDRRIDGFLQCGHLVGMTGMFTFSFRVVVFLKFWNYMNYKTSRSEPCCTIGNSTEILIYPGSMKTTSVLCSITMQILSLYNFLNKTRKEKIATELGQTWDEVVMYDF